MKNPISLAPEQKSPTNNRVLTSSNPHPYQHDSNKLDLPLDIPASPLQKEHTRNNTHRLSHKAQTNNTTAISTFVALVVCKQSAIRNQHAASRNQQHELNCCVAPATDLQHRLQQNVFKQHQHQQQCVQELCCLLGVFAADTNTTDSFESASMSGSGEVLRTSVRSLLAAPDARVTGSTGTTSFPLELGVMD